MAAGNTIVFPPIAGPMQFATVAQLKEGLSVVDPTGQVKNNIPADGTNPITIGWYEDLFPNAGALYNFVAMKLGYTTAQMTAFYGSLSSYPARP